MFVIIASGADREVFLICAALFRFSTLPERGCRGNRFQLFACAVAVFTLKHLLETVKLCKERSELLVFLILLQGMMQKTETEHELSRMFRRDVFFFLGTLCKSGEVMMTAKVEIHNFLYLTVNDFRHVDMVRTFFLIAIHN